MNIKLAKRMSNIKASEIREILKITERPDVISFAGGLPAPETFPIDDIKRINQLVLQESGSRALQYTTTEGYAPLRKWIANRMNCRLGTQFDEDNIMLTNGSQQALDLSGKLLLDEGDIILCESPTYLAAITAFRAYGCQFIEIPTDDNGMLIDELEITLQTYDRIKAIYVIPDFQNPTGNTWNLERRQALASLASRYQIAVIEDNPYGELRFEGAFLPSVKSFDKEGYVICTGTFSKIFCPGYRIAWVAGDKELIRQFVIAKQGTDLQCNTLAQMEIAKYLECCDIDAHIEKIREIYRHRRNTMLDSIKRYFPTNIRFSQPEGGLFAWVELPTYIDSRQILTMCLKENVAFVPGAAFFPNGGGHNTLRLNFSNMSEENIIEGIKRIGHVIHAALK